MNSTNRAFYLPRLPREYYQADAVVHWTLPVSHRRRGWLEERFHGQFRQLMLHAAAREGLLCPTYCLMPDHLHLVWMGLRRDSDQHNGMAFLRRHLEPALAPQLYSGKSLARSIGPVYRPMAFQRCADARLPDIPFHGGGFLAQVLEAISHDEASRCRKYLETADWFPPCRVAAEVTRL
jgi:hypothetical protein